MATVNGLTKEKTLELLDDNVIDGAVVDDRLILTRRDGTTFDAGIVKGNPGESASSPPGAITMFGGATAPTGHLLCDGSAVSRSTYSTLFGVIGTTYGVGDNSTTFNLPNLKGRIPVGLDPADTWFDQRGETGGFKEVTLTASEMPVHTHIQNSHNHTQNSHTHTNANHNHTQAGHDHTQNAHNHGPGILSGFMTYGTVGRTRVPTGSATDRIAITATATTELGITLTVTSDATQNSVTATATNVAAAITNDSTTPTNVATTPTNQNAGSGAAHTNMPPYIVLNYIIKT